MKVHKDSNGNIKSVKAYVKPQGRATDNMEIGTDEMEIRSFDIGEGEGGVDGIETRDRDDSVPSPIGWGWPNTGRGLGDGTSPPPPVTSSMAQSTARTPSSVAMSHSLVNATNVQTFSDTSLQSDSSSLNGSILRSEPSLNGSMKQEYSLGGASDYMQGGMGASSGDNLFPVDLGGDSAGPLFDFGDANTEFGAVDVSQLPENWIIEST
jgi:hypothetical protein